MTSIRYPLVAVVFVLSSCTWVETTKEGSEVTLVKAFNVENCKKLGSTTSSVKDKVGIFERGEEKVTEELITLARNKAAEMGGDSIVAQGDATDGKMGFDIYKCAK